MIVAIMPVDRRAVVAALAARQVVVARRRRPRPSGAWNGVLRDASTVARDRRSPSGTSWSGSGPGRCSPAVSKPKPAKAHRSASPEASTKTSRARARGRRGWRATIESTRPSRTSVAWRSGMEEDPGAGLGHEALPDDLEVLGQVGHAGAGAVRVGAFDDRSELAQRRDHVVADAAHDLAGAAAPACRSRRTCRGPRCSCRRGTAGDRPGGPRRLSARRRWPRGDPAAPDPTTQTSTSAMSGAGRVTVPWSRFAGPGWPGGGSGRRGRRDAPPAVHRQDLARDGPAFVAEQVGRGMGDVVGVEEVRDERLLAGHELGRRGIVRRALRHRRGGETRRDRRSPGSVADHRSRPWSWRAKRWRPSRPRRRAWRRARAPVRRRGRSNRGRSSRASRRSSGFEGASGGSRRGPGGPGCAGSARACGPSPRRSARGSGRPRSDGRCRPRRRRRHRCDRTAPRPRSRRHPPRPRRSGRPAAQPASRSDPSPAARSCACSAVREMTNTVAPSSEARRAVAAAIPVEPVTRTTRSRSRPLPTPRSAPSGRSPTVKPRPRSPSRGPRPARHG